MPDPHHIDDPLLDAAVRPLVENPELRLAAAGYLAAIRRQPSDHEEGMLRRWAEVDAKSKPVWKLVLAALTVMAAVVVLVSDLQGVLEFLNYRRDSEFSLDHKAEQRIAARLTPAQKVLMFGDLGSEYALKRKEALWESGLGNPAYFVEYAAAFHSDQKKLPDDFWETVRRIDPENAWFSYFAAGVDAVDCVKKKPQKTKRVGGRTVPTEPPAWEIIDEARLDYCIKLASEAASKPKCDNYYADMLRKRLPLLSQRSPQEQKDSMQYLINNGLVPDFPLRHVGDALAAKAWQLGESGKGNEFDALSRTADGFLRSVFEMEESVLLQDLLHSSSASRIAASFGPAAEKLGRKEETERWSRIEDRLRDWSHGRGYRPFLLDGKAVEKGVRTSILTGKWHHYTSTFAEHPPLLTDQDVRPMRLMDHEVASRFCTYAVWAILLLVIGLVTLFRYRVPLMIRGIGIRIETLLKPSDWAWMMALGLLPALLFGLAINRWSPFGGREFGLLGTYLILPAAQFLGVLVLWILVPVHVIRWRLRKQAGAFQISQGSKWLGFIPVVFAIVFVPFVGWAATTGMIPEFWVDTFDWVSPNIEGRTDEIRLWIAAGLLGVVLMWILSSAFLALFSTHSLLERFLVARALVPVWAAGMILLCAMTPLFKMAEQHWFSQDRLTKFDPSCAGWTHYEYRLALQVRKELRDILGYGK